MTETDNQKRDDYFIAVFLPQHICDELHQQVTQHGGGVVDDLVHWRSPEEYHISVAFPGRLTEQEMSAVANALEGMDKEAFTMSLEGMMWFPREQNKRNDNNHIIWTSPDRAAQNNLRELFLLTKKHLRDAGFEYGNENREPHVTIAYWPVRYSAFAKDFIAAADDVKTHSWLCDSIGIYKTMDPSSPEHPSRNDGQGSRYKEVRRIHLKPHF